MHYSFCIVIFGLLASLEKVQPVVTGLCELEDSLNDQVGQVKAMLELQKTKVLKKRGLCQLEHDGICFWVVSHDDWDLTYPQAQAICDNNGGKTANIYTAEQFAKTMVFLRTKILITHDHVNVWTGMRKNPTTNAATTDNGSTVPNLVWYSGSPTSSNSRNRITMVARISETTNLQGILDLPGSDSVGGVICEIQTI